MKNTLPFLGILLFSIPTLNAQSDRFTQDFQPIRNELTKWDPVRGEWLASSLVSISKNETVPDRTFPEDFTPAEMLRMVPESNRTAIQQTVATNQRNSTDSTNRNEWNSISSVLNTPNCKPLVGRSYGDPHLASFDGASYSFQTVGEFVLTKSATQKFEVQTRQQSQSDDFSLNTAVAMDVSGDRVSIYANEKPDNISNTALRVNGSPIYMSTGTYFLPKGGTIRYSSNTYIITWPTGEKVNAQIRNSSKMNFINLTVQIYPCAQQDLQGLLGNANGRESDDFDTKNPSKRPVYMAFSSFGNDQMNQASNEVEKEYLAFLAKDFASNFRVTNQTTLFDYGFGHSTFTYTDESFPRVHRTVGDLSKDRQAAARKKCEDSGIRGTELKGCIYDNAYLEIPPSPRPIIKDPTEGVILSRIEKPEKNINPERNGEIGIKNDKADNIEVTPTPQTISKPEDTKEKPTSVFDKVTPVESKPSNTSSGTKPAVIKPTSSKPADPKPTSPKPADTNPKPTGTVTTPVKSTPVIKPGKG